MLHSELERLALRHVPGEGAVFVSRLERGLVNQSYRVERGGRQYVLRVPLPNAPELGLDRGWECRVLERAMAAGIAPPIECCDPGQGILVTRWVDGAVWTAEEARRPESTAEVALLMRRIHALPVPPAARMMSPGAWIAHYHKALKGTGADAKHRHEQGSGVETRLAALALPPHPAAVLCHSDLHPQNLIAADDGLVLLDWEYAHVSEPFWDLAGWSCNNDFAADSRRLLLQSYLGRPPATQDEARLGALVWLYDYVCLLWSDLSSRLGAGTGAVGIGARAELLAARLREEPGGRGG
jgi:aminoglycoside phosphotransferase (APT) family kinase protein